MLCVCACVRVYVSMLIQGRALPNTPWKHSIHQQLEAGALGPALHFHWERGRQRRGGEKGGDKKDMRLPQGWEEGHSSVFSMRDETTGRNIYLKVERDKFIPRIVSKPSVELRMSVNKTQKLTSWPTNNLSFFFPGEPSLMGNWYLWWIQTDRYPLGEITQKQSWIESRLWVNGLEMISVEHDIFLPLESAERRDLSLPRCLSLIVFYKSF